MMLTNTKSLERKIQEIYLSHKIEKLYNKKEILEFYCNYVCFDGVNHGVLSASYKYFNKHVKQLTLPEAALLVGVVNAPTAYSPLLNPKNANNRKNVVLKLMFDHSYLNKNQYENALKINVEDLIIKNTKPKEESYPYQAYIDVVYKQIYEKTGYDPYITPMEIYTNMDSALQAEIDKMQQGTLTFSNDYQQFASTIIENQTGNIKAVFGGRNYKGQRLFNRAYDAKIQPASTIKMVLNYALAFEYLNYNSQETLLDIETTYPNSDISIKNSDNKFEGEMNIAKAVGYSKNTTAINTLKEVIDKIGVNKVVNYLKQINLMDEGEFSYSYGLGGYTYGVSVTSLAAAYSMITRKGLYIEPLAIKSIKLLDGSNKTFEFTPHSTKALSEDTCYLLIDVLKQVMDNNYWSIRDCKPANINVYAKTGTTSFDKNILEKYNIPSGASKDKWLASFTKDYTIVCWTGFDEIIKDKPTYFKKNSSLGNVTKEFSKIIYKQIAKHNQEFEKTSSLNEVYIVKGSNLLATSQVKDDYIVKALYKSEFTPTQYFEEPTIEEKVIYDYFILNDTLNFVFQLGSKKESYNKLFDYEKILGPKQILIDIYEDFIYKETIKCEQITSIPLNRNSHYKFDIYYKYENGTLDGKKEVLEFIYN